MATRARTRLRPALLSAALLFGAVASSSTAVTQPLTEPTIPAAASSVTASVVVYGGTPAGVMAAIAARRAGAGSVVLVEPTLHVGGMMTSGLNATDTGDKSTIGGIGREFFSRMQLVEGSSHGRYSFQSKNAEKVLKAMLAEAGVGVRYGSPLSEAPDAVSLLGQRIGSFTTVSGDRFSATVFVDASYEGDLMARAGVSYAIGRESPATYGEEFAGVRTSRTVVSGVGDLALGFPSLPPGPVGSADGRVQASNFRLCLSSVPANQVPFPKPAGYDSANYEVVLRYLTGLAPILGTPRLSWVLAVAPLVNGKWDANDHGAMSIAVPGANYDYPDGSYARRAEIVAWHRAYTQGFLYFLRNDPRVPSTIRGELAAFGLCKDEFTDNGNWPYQLYLREGRRMLADSVLTGHDIQAIRSKPDIIAIGSYKMDSHYVSRFRDERGSVRAEGMFWADRRVNYAIPYGIMVPRRSEATNLLVPVTSSASHVAQASLRMEPQYMMMGEAAGRAAALAMIGRTAVQDVNVATLQSRLRAAGAILADPGDIGTTLFYGDIVWAYHAGITSGCADGRFCPTAAVTREQMAAFLVRALDLPAANRDHYVDDEGSVFEDAINRLAEAGITRGCSAARFCPGGVVTRQQMASFLVRAFHLAPTATDRFTDDAGSVHEADINRLAAADITSGCSTTRFCPLRQVTRGEMLAFLHRAMR